MTMHDQVAELRQALDEEKASNQALQRSVDRLVDRVQRLMHELERQFDGSRPAMEQRPAAPCSRPRRSGPSVDNSEHGRCRAENAQIPTKKILNN